MGTVNIDFETRSEVPISVGASKYSKYCSIMCLAYMIDGGDVKAWWPGLPEPSDLLNAVRSGYVVRAFNAAFERCVWQNCMVAKYGWPEVDVKQWQCTMAEALAAGLPSSLDECAKSLNLEVTKDSEGRRIMLKMTKPRKARKAEIEAFEDRGQKVPVLWHDDPDDFDRLVAYCKQDVVVEAKIATKIRRLSSREIQVFHFDSIVNERGVQIDVDLARAAVELWDQHCKILEQELYRITFGGIESVGMLARIVDTLCKLGCYVPGLAKGTVAEALGWDHIGRTARRILEIRQELGMSSVSKFEKMLECIEADGRIRGCFQYHAAATGRWGGRLVQLQNLPRGHVEQDDIAKLIEAVKSRDLVRVVKESPVPLGKLLSSLVRSAIIAAPGKKLIVCDFAAVEARALAWAAGEEWLLQAFRNKDDAYKHMAASIYHVPFGEVTKAQRQVGKAATLGCGYGMSGAKFHMTLENGGIPSTPEFADEVVAAYRAKNAKIKKHWYATEAAAVRAIQAGGAHSVGPFKYYVKDDWLYCRLPSGRDIAYFKPQLVPGKYGPQIVYMAADSQTGKLVRVHTYGSCLVENNIQAMCRDLLVEGMSRTEKKGYTTILHVHDEIGAEVDEAFEGSTEEMEHILSDVPQWAAGFPMGAEGWSDTRYRK